MELGVWDLTALYKTNEQFLNDYKSAEKYLENVKKFRGKLSKKDPKVILDYFKMNDKFSLILEKIAVYAFLKRDDDGKNVESVKNYAMVDNFCTKASEELAFVRPELSELDDEFLKTLQNSPEFKDFDRVIEGVIRLKKHSLDENGEKNVAAVGGVCNSSDVYTTLSNVEMNHGEYENEKGLRSHLSHREGCPAVHFQGADHTPTGERPARFFPGGHPTFTGYRPPAADGFLH